MKNLRYITFLSLFALMLGISACSEDDDPDNGSIDITVGGLPSGVDANITVTGPGGFNENVTASTTLSDLSLGDYIITSSNVESNGTLYELSSDAVQTIAVTAGQTSNATVGYGEFAAPAGSIEVTITGVDGIQAAVTVSGPDGFSEQLTASGTLSDLTPGQYIVTTDEVNNGGQLFTVEEDNEEQEVTVSVDQTSEVEVNYLPGGDVVGIVGKWYSAGDDVAPLLVTLFSTDSIYAEFKEDMTYLVEQFDNSGTKLTLSGVYTQTKSSTGTIFTIEVDQTSPAALTSSGIFQVTSAAPDVMSYEIVQTSPDIGAVAPTPESGFGSTNGGVLGTTNVQTYRRLAEGEVGPPVGDIDITINGIGEGPADVMVTGPDGFSAQVTASSTLSALAPGLYTFTASDVNNSGQLLLVEDGDSPLEVTVVVDQTATVQIDYVPGGDILGIVGRWYSAGDDVAPLLVTLFSTDSIYAEFRDDMTYLVEQFDDSGAKLTLSGVYSQTASGVGTIYTIEINQSSPAALVSEGIFQIVSEAPDVMSYEIVQTSPDIGAVPPTPQDGFGSTNGGVLGTTNIQTYRRLAE